MSRTVEQRRAAYAFAFIGRQQNSNSVDQKIEKDVQVNEKLSTHIHKSPTLILQCGLGQALAFLCAEAAGNKSKPAMLLYQFLQEWLCGIHEERYPMRVYSDIDLMNALLNGSRSEYFRAQEESLRLFDWLKKFAAAKL